MTTAAVEVKERPILFSGPMVRAILEGRKTQTRRVIKPQPETEWMEWLIDVNAGGDNRYWIDGEPQMHINTDREFKDSGECPYGKPGDRLWVRETWQVLHKRDGTELRKWPANSVLVAEDWLFYFRATDEDYLPDYARWRPAIHMPRLFSRIQLEITNIKVERVQDITWQDCMKEGLRLPSGVGDYPTPGADFKNWYVKEFETLWNHINDVRGYGWEANPWVWVVEFKKIG